MPRSGCKGHPDRGKTRTFKDGKVEAEGKLEDLLQTSEEMRRLWRGNVGEEAK